MRSRKKKTEDGDTVGEIEDRPILIPEPDEDLEEDEDNDVEDGENSSEEEEEIPVFDAEEYEV